MILMMEDALEEMDQFKTHLQEGRAFYDVVIPKLEKLRLQVGDVSARLLVERCEFEDQAVRQSQEEQDARMAASLAGGGGGGGESSHGDGSSPNNSSASNHASSVSTPSRGGNIGTDASPLAVAGRSQPQPPPSPPSPEQRHNIMAVRNNSLARHSSGTPGVSAVSHGDLPRVRVDDEKVASLVAMDFDPDKVVAALKKYDNDVEHALNELLSG